MILRAPALETLETGDSGQTAKNGSALLSRAPGLVRSDLATLHVAGASMTIRNRQARMWRIRAFRFSQKAGFEVN